nr:hypothetical protein [Parachlamydiaceae bacterium]
TKETSSIVKDLKNCVDEIEILIDSAPKKCATFNQNGRDQLLEHSTIVNLKPPVKQIDVYSQLDDTTGSGFENCGYHSLKNAICLIASLSSDAPLQNAFKDPELYDAFYQNYAMPHVEHLKTGQKDATTPLLRAIIKDFISDPSPPDKLLYLQQILKKCNENSIGIFTTFPSSHDLGLSFGLFDEAGFKDAQKLFQFSQQPGPGVMFCPVGNVNTGHWYALSIIKQENGEIEFFGCDSLESGQKGGASPLGKISSFFLHTLTNPNEFINEALSSFVDTLHYAEWVDSKGVPFIGEDKAKLMELAKEPLYLPQKCLLAMEGMLEHRWTDSSNIQQLLSIHKIENLLRFYQSNLPIDSHEGIAISSVLKKIDKNFNFDSSVESLIDSTIFRLSSSLPNIAETEVIKGKESTGKILSHMLILYNKRKEIAGEKDQSSREVLAEALTHAGIEKGFISGKNSEEAKNRIEHRTFMLLTAIQKAEIMGKEDELYQVVRQGDPCLTARVGRIEEFLASLYNLGDSLQDMLSDKIFMITDTAIGEILLEMADDAESLEILTPADIDANTLAQFLKQLSTVATSELFKDYLVGKGYCETKENIDWLEVSTRLLPSKDFEIMFLRGKRIAQQYI